MATRRICFTKNNWTEEDRERLLKEEKFSYVVMGEEVGKEGTPHLQGYAEFARPTKWAPLAKKYAMHCETAVTQTEAITYCKKTGLFVERGTPRVEGGQAEKERWARNLKLAKEGKLEELGDIDPHAFTRCYRTYKEIAKDYMPDLPDVEIDNYWYYGPPGVGKSRKAREMAQGDFYPKLYNKWWDGYQGQQWVILDDYELDGKMLGHFMKIWADRYAFNAETKGGMLRIRPKHIVVTSNYAPEAIFEDSELLEAIKRRFKITKLV